MKRTCGYDQRQRVINKMSFNISNCYIYEEPDLPEELEEETNMSNLSWNYDKKSYRLVNNVQQAIKPGYYETYVDGNNQPFFYEKDLLPCDIVNFADGKSDEIIKEITNFWGMKEKYDKYGLVFKRGYILYGPPGSGKSSIIRLIIDQIISIGGMAVDFNSLKSYTPCMNILRQIHPDMKVVVLMEDVDEIISSNNESSLLNILDGANQLNNIIYVATTNYPEKLGERIINRPSRFDRRFKMPLPGKASRRMYLLHLFNKGGIDCIGIIDKYVKDTAKMSIAHIKELFTVVHILGDSYEESLETIKIMNTKNVSSTEDQAEGFGFKTKEEED